MAANPELFVFQLAVLHPTKETPYISSICQTIFMSVMIILLALLGQDPLIDIFTWASAITTMAILLLQIFVSIAVIAYFRKRPELAIPKWKTVYAPVLASILMSIVLCWIDFLHESYCFTRHGIFIYFEHLSTYDKYLTY